MSELEDKINKALHGVIQPGSCFHDVIIRNEENHGSISGYSDRLVCSKCEEYHPIKNPDYFSKEGFWDAWEWLNKNYSLTEFVFWIHKSDRSGDTIVDYKIFARNLHDFLVAEGIITESGS